ncbi:MAG: aminoacyl-tRNA hydrolase [Patescibacteria group bacterium]
MKITFGLGNPGKEYENTRHNVGFRAVDYLNDKYGESFSFNKKLNLETSEINVSGKKLLLVKPQTFVNKSGEAVKKLMAKSKLRIADLIIIHDDLDIPFGKVKVSFGRSSAGHKGIDSIIRALKTNKFYRIRVGTFNNQIMKIKKMKGKKKIEEVNKFVIGPFSSDEKSKLNKLIKEAAEKALLI